MNRVSGDQRNMVVCVRANSQHTSMYTNKTVASAKIFLLPSAKTGVSSQKTSNIFNNYTYLQRCDEAKLSISNQHYVGGKKEDLFHSFFDQNSLSLGFWMAVTALYCDSQQSVRPSFSQEIFVQYDQQNREQQMSEEQGASSNIQVISQISWSVCVHCGGLISDRGTASLSLLSICVSPVCKGPTVNCDPLTQV